MEVLDRLLTLGASHARPGTKVIPKGIVIHYVGNPSSSAIANRNYFENTGNASAHYIVGLEGEIIRCVPEDEVAWHSGRAYDPKYNEQVKKNNSMYIAIECCHPTEDGKYNTKTYNSLVSLCKDICKRHNFKEKDILRHYDVSGKACPLYYVRNESAWKTLVTDIIKTYENEEEKGDDFIAYRTYEDIPSYGKPTIKKLIDKGLLVGNGQGEINLTESMLRIFVVHDRAGLYNN